MYFMLNFSFIPISSGFFAVVSSAILFLYTSSTLLQLHSSKANMEKHCDSRLKYLPYRAQMNPTGILL